MADGKRGIAQLGCLDKRMITQPDWLNKRTTIHPPTPRETSPDSPTPSVSLPVSSVDMVIAELRNRNCGRLQVEEEWRCISLGRSQFNTLETRIKVDKDIYWSKYDYFPNLAKFVLRMAKTQHESVHKKFERHII
ncbi:hypothetical protein B0T25DRAFT_566473 [Lasiosphaeria hispida]|uniref:Uncharacterized protein n=1 Tax=Lasiosphaeria hispida TaxID=260671 RepID=A0AAJ0MFW1_9PEZI|nr:hypothetical protein B0T25DRAFT_566473 [Lasiosphaeria hispida]